MFTNGTISKTYSLHFNDCYPTRQPNGCVGERKKEEIRGEGCKATFRHVFIPYTVHFILTLIQMCFM